MKSVERKHTRHEYISFSHRHSEHIVQMQRGKSTQLWSYQPDGAPMMDQNVPFMSFRVLKQTVAALVIPRQSVWLVWNWTLWSCVAAVLGYRWWDHVLNHKHVTRWITGQPINRRSEVTSSESVPSWGGAAMCLWCVIPTPACVSVIFFFFLSTPRLIWRPHWGCPLLDGSVTCLCRIYYPVSTQPGSTDFTALAARRLHLYLWNLDSSS